MVGYVGLLTSHNPASFVMNFSSVTSLRKLMQVAEERTKGRFFSPEG